MENKDFKRRLITKAIVGGAFLALTIGAVIGVNVANDYIKPYEGFITSTLCSVNTGGEKNSLGDKLAVEIEQEGIVLAKNENDVLPLAKENKKVDIYGHAVVDWLISNSGSGSSGPGSSQKSVGLLEAFEMSGKEYNQDIINFYKSWCTPRSLPYSISSGYESLYRLADPSLSGNATFKSVYDTAKADPEVNTAIVVLSRVAGEHIDPPHQQINNYVTSSQSKQDLTRGYLEITKEEEELLTAVGEDYEKVIVIINSANIMQMDFMETIPGLDACLLVGPTGTVGAKAIPQVLWGAINPSGRTADTWPMKHWYNPTYYTSGKWWEHDSPHYTDITSGANLKTSNGQGDSLPNLNFADYVEGIYVGYRWYETAFEEGYWDKAPYNGYENVVAYPFGHGLSYTKFDWKLVGSVPSNNSVITGNQDVTLQVEVTNSGEVAGRDVVEVYLTADYYEGEIEKSSVKLVGYQKTRNLAPGETQPLTITLHTRDFLSFDCYDANGNGHAGWELDRGNYKVKLMTSAHEIKDPVAGGNTVTFRAPDTVNVDDDTATGEPSKPLFTGDDTLDGISIDGKSIGEPIEYISRKDFDTEDVLLTSLNPNRKYNTRLNVSQGQDGASAPNAYSRTMRDAWDNYDKYDDDTVVTDPFDHDIPSYEPVFGSSGTQKVQEKEVLTSLGETLAQDYDAPEWEDLLDQVTWEESLAIVNNSSSYNRPGIKSVGLRNGSNNDYKDVEAASQVGVDLDNKTRRFTAYPTPTVQAQCWNTDMPYLFGLSEARDMIIGGADASYGPASNIHRSPYGGRSSEYHSEDGFLAGCTLAAVTKGLSDGGKQGFIKHFVANDTEYHRVGLYTWMTEQALREVYLRPFEEAVKRGEATAVMTSFNRLGATWTGGSEALIQGVLRNEWGFKGMIITDMIENPTMMDANMHFRAGCNYILGGSGWNTGIGGSPDKDNSTLRLKWRVRENAKQVIYAHIRVLYNNQQYNANPNNKAIVASTSRAPWVWWKPALYSVEAIVIVGFALGVILALVPADPEFRGELKNKFKKKEPDNAEQ